MSMVPRPLLVLLTTAAVCVGCGSSNGKGTATSAAGGHGKPTGAQVTVNMLRAGVRTAIDANVQLSTYVLWHNRIPAWATRSTRGPALNALRSAAETRRQQGIQIKNLSGGYTIVAISLDPSLAAATAVVRSHQEVAPYRAGRRLGKSISARDHARIHLRRLGSSRRFVVWSVATN